MIPHRFSHPPSYTAHISEQQAGEQVAAVRSFAALLEAVPSWPKLAEPTRSATKGPPATSEDVTPGTKLLLLANDVLGKLKIGKAQVAQTATLHPVWGDASVSPTEVVALLRFLLR